MQTWAIVALFVFAVLAAALLGFGVAWMLWRDRQKGGSFAASGSLTKDGLVWSVAIVEDRMMLDAVPVEGRLGKTGGVSLEIPLEVRS